MTNTNVNFSELTYKNYSQACRNVPFSYLGSTENSSKTAKGKKYNISTYITYLAPSNVSGYQVCPNASKECRESCIFVTGLTKVEDWAGRSIIRSARINKTRLFFENQDFYFQMLIAEIRRAKNYAAKIGNLFAVRLNGTSDICFENYTFEGKTIFEIFPNVTFYDYTKVPNRQIANITNYSLTFSYTGRNTLDCFNALESGQNVAIVFNTERGEALPDFWRNYPVIDGDLTDYRPADKLGAIVGLRFKESAKEETNKKALESVFVVDKNSLDCAKVFEPDFNF